MDNQSRAQRTPDEILRSVIAYCEWRAGECCRSLSTAKFRNDQDRWDYLTAARLIQTVRYAPSPKPQQVLTSSPDSLVISLSQQPRVWLVSELLRADSSLTDTRILLRLSRAKLARMLLERVGRARLAASLRAACRDLRRAKGDGMTIAFLPDSKACGGLVNRARGESVGGTLPAPHDLGKGAA